MIARRALAVVVRACLEWGQRQWSTVLGVIVGQCFLWWRPLVGRDSATSAWFLACALPPRVPFSPFHSGVCIQSQVHRIRRGRWAHTCGWRRPHCTLCQCWAAVGTGQRLPLSLPIAVVVPPADPKAHASLIPIQRCLVCAGAVGVSGVRGPVMSAFPSSPSRLSHLFK
jgi:hypothetical protein